MKSSSFGLFALTALAVTGSASAARADMTTNPFNESFGSGDVQAALAGQGTAVYCNASELALAGKRGACVQMVSTSNGGEVCVQWAPLYPECMVRATQEYGRTIAAVTGSMTVFGTTKNISVETSAITADGMSSMELVVTAFGSTLIDTTRSGVRFVAPAVFEAKKTYGIAGVSVGVTGVVAATIGGEIGGGTIANGIQVVVTPTIDATLEASTDVDVECASAGVDGSIDIFDVQVPTNLDVTYANNTIGYGVDATLDYTVLSGDLSVSACLCGVCDSHTIASYGGFSNEPEGESLGGISGSFSL